jgi:hypothetical protein
MDSTEEYLVNIIRQAKNLLEVHQGIQALGNLGLQERQENRKELEKAYADLHEAIDAYNLHEAEEYST